MKPVVISLLAFLLFSCEKTTIIPEDRRCFNLIVDKQNDQLLPEQQIDTIKMLFQKNNLSYVNLKFFKFGNTPYDKYILAYQYVNDLKLFTDEVNYHFNVNSELYFMNDSLRVTTINQTNLPKLTRGQVRYLFFKEVEKDHFYSDVFHSVNSLELGCVNAEFGYYNLNAGSGSQPKKYTTAWRIHPSNQDYPYAYINDQNGRTIYYFNGIITGK